VRTLDLDPLRETLLLTLYARALDSELPHPILGDTHSADIAGAIDYDFAKLRLKPSLVCGTALRAKKLDEAVRTFVAAPGRRRARPRVRARHPRPPLRPTR